MQAFTNESKYYNIFHFDKDYAKEAREIRKKFPKAKTVLEIGSGTGLMTVELEKLGFKVIGLEPSVDMIRQFEGNNMVNCTLEEYSFLPKKKFDLVLALYDVLNYSPNFWDNRLKIRALGKDNIIEVWDKNKPVYPFMYKRARKCRRIRLGFKFMNKAYLWYIFTGKGLVISFHKLYLH
jgi:SAM-dependent methyltransferase